MEPFKGKKCQRLVSLRETKRNEPMLYDTPGRNVRKAQQPSRRFDQNERVGSRGGTTLTLTKHRAGQDELRKPTLALGRRPIISKPARHQCCGQPPVSYIQRDVPASVTPLNRHERKGCRESSGSALTSRRLCAAPFSSSTSSILASSRHVHWRHPLGCCGSRCCARPPPCRPLPCT